MKSMTLQEELNWLRSEHPEKTALIEAAEGWVTTNEPLPQFGLKERLRAVTQVLMDQYLRSGGEFHGKQTFVFDPVKGLVEKTV